MYSSIADMVARFGEAELVRLTTPLGADRVAIDGVRVAQALTDASGLIDSYLRRRYAVPLAAPPAEVTRAAAVLARYDLAFGPDRAPTEETRLARKDVVSWLDGIAAGSVTLDGAVPAGEASYARTSDRTPDVSHCAGGACDRFRL